MKAQKIGFWILVVFPYLNLAGKYYIESVSYGAFGEECLAGMEFFFMTNRENHRDFGIGQVLEEKDILEEIEMIHRDLPS